MTNDMIELMARAFVKAAFPGAELNDTEWKMWVVETEAAANAYETYLADNGFVVVPREPTEAMIDAVIGHLPFDYKISICESVVSDYTAMINASQEGHDK